jgi:hypothetical protein
MMLRSLVFLIFIGGQASAIAAQVPDLSELLSPVAYPLLTAQVPKQSMQFRLQMASQFVEKLCARTIPTNDETAWICLWPKAIKELDLIGTTLTGESPDANNLFLTLAARLHPDSLFKSFDSQEDLTFDALYARYLIANRMLRELWPSVERRLIREGQFQDPIDRFIEPWLTTETPWSFAWRSMIGIRCGGDQKACELRAKLARFLRGSLNLIDEDSVLTRVSSLDLNAPLYPQLKSSDLRSLGDDQSINNDLRINDLLQAALENQPRGYAFVLRDLSDLRAGIFQYEEYFHNIENDSKIKLAIANEPKPQLCQNWPLMQNQLKQIGLNFVRIPDGLLACAEDDDRVKMAYHLEATGSLYRYNYFEIRSAIFFLYPSNRANRLDPRRIRLKQLERSLRNELLVINLMRAFHLPELNPSEDEEKISWTKMMLMDFYKVITELGKL